MVGKFIDLPDTLIENNLRKICLLVTFNIIIGVTPSGDEYFGKVLVFWCAGKTLKTLLS